MRDWTADTTNAERKDRVVLTTFCVGSLRREEVTTVKLAFYDPVIGRLLVHDKENKECKVYLVNKARNAMVDWLTIRGMAEQYIITPGSVQERLKCV